MNKFLFLQTKNNIMSIVENKIKNLPEHVAVIMDGNGRWAKQQNKERYFGHQHGAESARVISETASKLGIKYLTLYAFSKENWNRPKEEVFGLMNLLIQGVNDNLDTINKLNIKLLTIGDYVNLPQNVREAVDKSVHSTKDNTGLNLIIALNYGSRWEMINAVKNIAQDVKNNKIYVDDIKDELFDNYLLTKDIPDPDLLIRTSGEYRISNFLLWQLSYSELYFTDCFWPEFREEQFMAALLDYSKRERRFGKTSKQLKK